MLSNNDFNKKFNRTRKMIVVFIVVNAVVAIALTTGIVWTAWHFISKFW